MMRRWNSRFYGMAEIGTCLRCVLLSIFYTLCKSVSLSNNANTACTTSQNMTVPSCFKLHIPFINPQLKNHSSHW